jgi:hypothetical protein
MGVQMEVEVVSHLKITTSQTWAHPHAAPTGRAEFVVDVTQDSVRCGELHPDYMTASAPPT